MKIIRKTLEGKIPESIVFKVPVIVKTFFCRDDFDTDEEWLDFLNEVTQNEDTLIDKAYGAFADETLTDHIYGKMNKMTVTIK